MIPSTLTLSIRLEFGPLRTDANSDHFTPKARTHTNHSEITTLLALNNREKW